MGEVKKVNSPDDKSRILYGEITPGNRKENYASNALRILIRRVITPFEIPPFIISLAPPLFVSTRKNVISTV